MNLTGWALAGTIAASVTGAYGSPYYAIQDIKDAAQARDAERLSGYIDYASL